MSSSVACLAPVDLAIGYLQPSASGKDQVQVSIVYGKGAASQRPIGVKDRRKDGALKLQWREGVTWSEILASVVGSLERGCGGWWGLVALSIASMRGITHFCPWSIPVN